MIFITHDLSVLSTVADRLAVMYAGRLVETGPAKEMLRGAKHPYTKALAAAFPTIGDQSSRLAPSGLAGDPPDPMAVPVGCPVPPPLSDRDAGVRSHDGGAARDLARMGGRVSQAVSATAPRGIGCQGHLSIRGTADLPVQRSTASTSRLEPGEIVALVGESGCGKTTLARAVLGLQPLSAGSISFDGSPLSTSRSGLRAYRRKAQLVFQDPTGSINPRQSIYEIVAEGLRIHHEKVDEEARVAAALSESGLRPPEQFFFRFPHELSGGQRQRVVIAGAMVLQPSLLVADEPVSSLDASVRGEILQLLLGLSRERGMTILVVTHDLGWRGTSPIASP